VSRLLAWDALGDVLGRDLDDDRDAQLNDESRATV
jgi:hypothetical protein